MTRNESTPPVESLRNPRPSIQAAEGNVCSSYSDPKVRANSSELASLLSQSHNLFATHLSQHARTYGVSDSQYRVMLILSRVPNKKLTMSELSEQMCVTRTSITKVIDGLSKAAFVERQVHPHDRRSILVQLTAQGIQFLTMTVSHHQDFLDQIFGELTADQQRTLTKLLDRLIVSWLPKSLETLPTKTTSD